MPFSITKVTYHLLESLNQLGIIYSLEKSSILNHSTTYFWEDMIPLVIHSYE